MTTEKRPEDEAAWSERRRISRIKFVVTVDRDEDGVFVAECPSIPGCVSQGATESEALKNIEDAIRECLEVQSREGYSADCGRPPGGHLRLTEKLPLLPGRKVAQAFVKLGWQVARQRGSHIILVKAGHIASLSAPDHREVARGTPRSLLRSADVELKESLKVAE